MNAGMERAEGGAAAAEPLGAVTPCSDRAKQIPKDPYSPPCLAFAGNNGGATSRGVTRDTIRLGIRFPADPIDFGQAFQFLADHGIHETREDLERTALGLLDYFNATFQFYGRKIEPVLWQGAGSPPRRSSAAGRTPPTPTPSRPPPSSTSS